MFGWHGGARSFDDAWWGRTCETRNWSVAEFEAFALPLTCVSDHKNICMCMSMSMYMSTYM